MNYFEDSHGNKSSNRLIFVLSFVTIIGLMIYTVIIGDGNKADIVERYASILLPTTAIAKVVQSFSEK